MVPLYVIYEGWVIVKAWSAPGWLAGVVAADQGVVAWTSHLFGRGRPWCRAARGGSIKLAAVAQQGHDTHRARPDQAAGYDVEGTG
jgi:hypothetical protein